MKDKELGLIQCSGMFADIINILAVIVGVQHPGAFTVAFYVTDQSCFDICENGWICSLPLKFLTFSNSAERNITTMP